MKKISTVAAKPSRKISQQKLTIGLDLGDRNSWYCVLDEAGTIQLEQRMRTTAKALQEVFGAMPSETIRSSRVRMEAWRQWLLGRQENHVHKKPRIDLTPTVLLMEGLFAHLADGVLLPMPPAKNFRIA